MREIARVLRLSRLTVRKVLQSNSVSVPEIQRPEKAEPYRQQILDLLASCKGNLVRVHEELQASGAAMSYQALTAFCRRQGIGQTPVVPAGQYHFEPGVEMQHDTSPHEVEVGGRKYKAQTASAVLCYYSCLTQDEPEKGKGFSHKMSLKDGIGMLGIDHQHGRFGSDKPGAGAGVSGWQRRSAIYRAEAGRSVRVDGTDAGPFRVRRTGQGGQGSGAALAGAHDGSEPGAGDAVDRRVYRERARQGKVVSAQEIRCRLHQRRCAFAGPCRSKSWKSEWSGDQTDSAARIQRVRSGSVRALCRRSRWRRFTGSAIRRPTGNAIRLTSRHAPRPSRSANGANRGRKGRPGYLRIDTVHQGDQDGNKGVYHINAVDEVTQWEIVAATPQISERWLIPVLEQLLEQFPFAIRGFHSDNGSEFINYRVAGMLEKLLIEQTKSRAYRTGDNGLVESKNGAVVRKHLGFGHIGAEHAEAVDQFHRHYLNPYINYRPCAVPDTAEDPNGKPRRTYPPLATPFEIFTQASHCESCLRPGVSMDSLRQLESRQTDTEAAIAMQRAKQKLFAKLKRSA